MEKERKHNRFLDHEYIEGVYQYDPLMEHELYILCKDYYNKYFHMPNVDEEGRNDILQSSLLALWDNIRNRKLFVEDGELKGKDGQPFTSSLTTYFMSIAYNKYLEWLRSNSAIPPIRIKMDKVAEKYADNDFLDKYDDDDETVRRKRILSHRMSHIPKQCNKILTLFYYEEKDYEEIMVLMPTFQSKDALKTAKYKCMKRLRESVIGTYR